VKGSGVWFTNGLYDIYDDEFFHDGVFGSVRYDLVEF
jgi:hypothetical protein